MTERRVASNFNLGVAAHELGLTYQEQNLYQHHLNNLNGAGKFAQPDGAISTVLQAVVSPDNKNFYNIPTVWDGKQLSIPEATQRAAAIGWSNWPSYGSPDEADARYESMHRYMDNDVERYLGNK